MKGKSRLQDTVLLGAPESIEELGAIGDLRGEMWGRAVRVYWGAEAKLDVETRRDGRSRSGNHHLPGRERIP